jgi:hypothetical protein
MKVLMLITEAISLQGLLELFGLCSACGVMEAWCRESLIYDSVTN